MTKVYHCHAVTQFCTKGQVVTMFLPLAEALMLFVKLHHPTHVVDGVSGKTYFRQEV